MKLTMLLIGILANTVCAATDLPVKKIVLYKHGIGYFERSGVLKPGAAIHFDFKASEMNDVLKTLTLVEKNGTKISGLHYDSHEPLERKLADFPFRIGDKQPLSAILDQLKGNRVEIRFASETATGTIVSARTSIGDEKKFEREQVSLLTDSGEIRNLDLGAATSLRFVDLGLQEQFKTYLTALVQSRSKEKRNLYINADPSRERHLFASYIVPSPVWKSTYRLIFGPDAEPTLEAWAIIHNTTGEDWKNVELSLVSGRPISFVSRLYEPHYLSRSLAELPDDWAKGPVIHEGAIAESKDAIALKEQEQAVEVPHSSRKDKFAPDSPSGIGGGTGGGVGMGAVAGRLLEGGSFGSDARSELRPQMPSSLASTALARQFGELFEYKISNPVNVFQNESASVPFLQQRVNARKIIIHADQNSAHPMNAVELSNSTGKTLDGGPITIFDSGAYAGEALMETLKNKDKRLISYAVDLGTRITTNLDSHATPVREIRFNRGMLTTRSSVVETKTYTIRNIDQKPKILILEHPIRPEYKLLNQKPAETTSWAYRFEVKLAAGRTENFSVAEEKIYESSSVIAQMTPDVLFTYIQNKVISESGRRQLQQILSHKQQIAKIAGEIQGLEADVNAMIHDQDRIRQNINSLNQVNGQDQQVRYYAEQLVSQESQFSSLRNRLSDLKRNHVRLQAELATMIENTAF